MGAGHSHTPASGANEKRLWIALGLTATYMVAEVVGGYLTGSLALLSDAAHMFTDVAALGISLAAIRIGQRPADTRRTFGYYRFEILAAALNAVLLFLVAGYILYEAVERFQRPPEIQSIGMMVVASMGLVVNIISIRLLQSGSQESLNVKGAYLEVWSDLLGSIGVIAAAMIIRTTGWWAVDPILAVAIGLWVLPRTWLLLKESLNILLEGVPEGLELAAVQEALASIPGVLDIHELHVWAITSGKASLTAHLMLDPAIEDGEQVLEAVTRLLKERFHIAHSTIQVERSNCQPDDLDCNLGSHEHE